MRVFLPYPPSANDRLTVRKGGKGFVNTDRYRAWKSEAAWVVAMAARDQGSVPGHYTLDVVVMRPRLRRTRDLDNLLKAISDALKDGGAIEDDSLCQMIRIAWGQPDEAGPGVLCRISKCPSPLLPEAGRSKPQEETVRSLMPRHSRRAATIPDVEMALSTATAQEVVRASESRPSSTPADDIACPTKGTKPKA